MSEETGDTFASGPSHTDDETSHMQYGRQQGELPASAIEEANVLPGVTPPMTTTEPFFGSSSATGMAVTMVSNSNMSSQLDNVSSRRARPRSELGEGHHHHNDHTMSESDGGTVITATSNRQSNSHAVGGAVGTPGHLPNGRNVAFDQLSIALSNPHQQAVAGRSGMRNNVLGTPSNAPSQAPADDTTLPSMDGIGASPAVNRHVPPSNERVRVIWGTNIVISDAIAAFRAFLMSFTMAHRKISDARLQDPSIPLAPTTALDLEPLYSRLFQQIHDTEIYNLNVDCANLRAFPRTLLFATQLLHYPNEIVSLMDMVVNEYFSELYPEVDISNDPIQVRPFNTGKTVNMRELDPSDIDKLITIKGLIIRVSNIVPDMRVAFFTCGNCGHSTTVENVRGRIAEPSRCPRDGCNALHSMVLVHNRCMFSDKQIIKIQETPDSIPDGQTPHSVSLCVYDALVDVARPGDRVEITGIFRSAPVRVSQKQRRLKTLFRTFIDVVHLKRTDKDRLRLDSSLMSSDDFLIAFDETDAIHQDESAQEEDLKSLSSMPDLYDRLSHSIAPSVWGLDDVKKGLLMQLFGGVSKTLRRSGNARFRGDINILLAGDPGVSKSQLLQYVHKLAPRGIYTSGKGSSAVGLTAYITRDAESNQLVLESGALVLSDGGICCIDEFDKMSDETRTILHEVMEQQTVSIAKAGIITTLNARTSILASANPIESKYNPQKSIVNNLNLPPTILSRFDIIYLILDNVSMDDDQRLGRHIVMLYTNGGASRVRSDAIVKEPTLLHSSKMLISFHSPLSPHPANNAPCLLFL